MHYRMCAWKCRLLNSFCLVGWLIGWLVGWLSVCVCGKGLGECVCVCREERAEER